MGSKIISFCLWGEDLKYTIGAVRNAKLAVELFPGWKCWFYVRTKECETNFSALKILATMSNTNLIFVDKPGNWTGMFDRFQPAVDSNVDVMISRDCDSRLSFREAAAVQDWLKSGKGFHIMRDHPWHGSKILGGMWGCRSGALPEFLDLMYGWNQEDRWQTDQDFLNQEIYPRIVDDARIHASFVRLEEHATDFPLLRNGTEFIGQVFDENEATVPEHLQALVQAL